MLDAQPGDVQPEEAQAGEEPGEIRFAVSEAAAHSTDLISYVRSATELSGQPLTCVHGGDKWVAWQGQHRLAHEEIRAIIDGATPRARHRQRGDRSISAVDSAGGKQWQRRAGAGQTELDLNTRPGDTRA